MPIQWFICPYKKISGEPERYCAMDDFTAQIYADGGSWCETEILGDRAIVKVKASQATIDTISATAGFKDSPVSGLDDPLDNISQSKKDAIKNELLNQGYTQADADSLGDFIGKTLRDVAAIMCQRRLKPRYDSVTDTIICDGSEQSVKNIDSVDQEV